MRTSFFASVLGILLLAGAGCPSQTPAEPTIPSATPTPVTTEPTPTIQPANDPAETAALAKLQAAMKTGGNFGLSNKPVAADQKFNAALDKSGVLQTIYFHTTGGVLLMSDAKHNEYLVLDQTFKTAPGPYLKVYLTKNSDPTHASDIAEGVLIGSLKSSLGKQVYTIPKSVDWKQYQSLTIYSSEFSVPWAFAPLK